MKEIEEEFRACNAIYDRRRSVLGRLYDFLFGPELPLGLPKATRLEIQRRDQIKAQIFRKVSRELRGTSK